MHLLDEIAAERDQQHDAQQTAEQRRKEDLVKRRVQPQDVERRQREDRPGDDHARRSADRLDDDVLAQHVALAEHAAHAHGDNGDRDRRLEHLSDFESQIGRRSRKDDGHDDAHPDRIGRHFGGSGRRRQHRRVLLARRQLAVGVLRQRGQLFFLFHSRFLSLNSRLIDKVRNFFEKSIFRPPNSADPKGTA